MQLFKGKIILRTLIDVNVRFAQDMLPMLVILFFFCDPESSRSKIPPL